MNEFENLSKKCDPTKNLTDEKDFYSAQISDGFL